MHTLYLIALFTGFAGASGEMVIVLVAYVLYAINAAQFLLKLRAARLEAGPQGVPA